MYGDGRVAKPLETRGKVRLWSVVESLHSKKFTQILCDFFDTNLSGRLSTPRFLVC
jgi:hypothetical protein